MRLRDATQMAGPHEPARTQLANFDAIGATVRFGDARVQVIAVNPGFPAADLLRELIVALEPEPPRRPRLPLPRDLVVPTHDVDALGPRDLFGPWRQTAVLLVVAAAGGQMTLGEVNARLRTVGSKTGDTTAALKRLANRNLVVVEEETVRLAEAVPLDEMVAFARAFTARMPDYALRIPLRVPPPRHAPVKRYQYGGGEGLPELFGRPARYKVLSVLAVHGAMRRTDLLATARVAPSTVEQMVADRWLRVGRAVRGNVSRTAVTIANVPGRDELLALVRRMTDRWPAPPASALVAPQHAVEPGRPVAIPVEAFFGSSARSETLLTLAAMGTADVSMLERAVHVHDRQEIARALRTCEAFGIVRVCELDGRRAGGFELDPDWFAAAELRALLDVLLEREPRYQARADGAEAVMPPRRLKRKKNARKLNDGLTVSGDRGRLVGRVEQLPCGRCAAAARRKYERVFLRWAGVGRRD